MSTSEIKQPLISTEEPSTSNKALVEIDFDNTENLPSTSTAVVVDAPPSFSDSASNALVDIGDGHQVGASIHEMGAVKRKSSFDDSGDGGESERLLPIGSPPEFELYEPEYFVESKGDIVSHDKHLNEDGEALYRFLLEHASERPTLLLKCSSSHTEWRTRQVSRYENGRNVTYNETYSERIVDFDFTIDVSSSVLSEPAGAPIWIVGDNDAAYRGTNSLDVDGKPRVTFDNDASTTTDLEPGVGACGRNRSWRRKATKAEQTASEVWSERRQGYGYAPWVLVRGQIRGTEASVESAEARLKLANATRAVTEHGEWYDDSVITEPSKSLRAWSDEYCISKRRLKEFIFKKVVYGWNMAALKQAIDTTIKNNYVHYNDPQIDFILEGDTISIRPNSRLSRMLGSLWWNIFLWVTLIFPLIIWPYKKFSSRGGGTWKVAGSAFALTKWVHCEDSQPGDTIESYQVKIGTPSSSSKTPVQTPLLKATTRGISKLEGTREGEWFGRWEDTIGSLVRQRYISNTVVLYPVGASTAGIGLDGYYPDSRRLL